MKKQEQVNKELRGRIESDKRAIEEGKLKPAPTFLSEINTLEEMQEAKDLDRILYLNLEFTNLCNLGCTGCFNYYSDVFSDFDETQIHPPSDSRGDLLSHEQILDVITQAADFGAKSIDLMGGGEPLAYKRFIELVEHSRKVGLDVETFTNGTLITQDLAHRLFENEVTPYVKVYSLNPEVHDVMVNRRGAHKRVMRGIEFLKEAGYGSSEKPVMAIETIIVNKNIEEMPDMWRFARDNNFLPYFERFVGCDYEGDPNALPSPKRLKELWENLLELDKEEYGFTFPLLPLRVGYSCGAPRGNIYVQCDGSVRPCSGTWVDLGNVKDKPLRDIVQGSQILKSLRDIDETMEGYCTDCEYSKEYDCAGCRGQSTLLNGKIIAEDPLCFHNPANLEKPHGGKD